MPGISERRKHIEGRLRSRLAETEEPVSKCGAAYRDLIRITGDLDLLNRSDLLNSEGRRILIDAMLNYNEAIRSYSQAVREWTEYVLRGTTPAWINNSQDAGQNR